jgi:hypothetical protein
MKLFVKRVTDGYDRGSDEKKRQQSGQSGFRRFPGNSIVSFPIHAPQQ